MPLVLADRVRETTTTTGTGTITLAGAVTGYQSFSAIGNGNTTYYTINAGSQWEVGIGTYTGAGPSLSRDIVLESSNAGSLVNFSAGTKDVFVTYPAEKSISDGYGLLPIANGGTGATTAGGALTSLGAYPASNPNGYTSNTGTVTSVNLTAGTGISVSGGPITSSGSITVNNTAPDQVVSLTGAGTTSISGTYPNFTITSNDSTLGTVTSVAGTGTVNGITLTGTVTSSGSLTLGGTLTGVNLTSQVTGTLPIANGGTGATSAAAALTSLGAYPASNPNGYTSNTGTVTSVGGTGTVSGLSLSGTVTTSGNLTLGGTLAVTPSNFASQTANTVLAAPNGTAGVPTFRALVAADIPTLNQNTTGTAANVTGTVAIANGGTGATTAPNARTNLGATTIGSNVFTLTNPSAITFPRFNADNTVSALDAATFRTAIGAGTSSTTGTVTSVGGTGTVSGLTLSGTVTTSGNLTLGGTLAVTPSNFASQTANTFLAAPNGTAGTPTFRAIVAADIPTLNQNTTGSAGSAANITGGNQTGSYEVTSGQSTRFGSANQTDGNDGKIGAGLFGSGLNIVGTQTSAGTGRQIRLYGALIDSSGVEYVRNTGSWGISVTGTAANVTGTVAIANGGTGATTAPNARTNLGATTVGSNLFTLTNPSAIRFLRVNADNTVSTLDAATFRTAIGAGTSSTTGTVTSVGGTGSVNGITLTGTVTSSGNLTLGGTLSGVSLTTQVSGTLPIANGGTNATSAAAALTSLGAYPATNPNGYISGNQTITLSGDVTGSGATAITTTLANSGVSAGTYNSVTVNAKGIVTAATVKQAPNVQSVTSSATVTPNADTNDLVSISAQAVALTIAAPSGTSTDGEKMIIRIKDNGSTQTINWNGVYAAGGAALPTATVAGKWHHVGFIYNSNTTTWLCVAASVQA